MKKAVLLLSGGLDSATAGALAIEQGFTLHAISYRYGQRHEIELKSAQNIAKLLKVAEHKIADIDLRLFGGSALTDNIEVPKNRATSEIEQGVPITYVPARNTIFLSFALAYAEVINAHDIFIGVNAIDYSGYPDCRPEFIKSFEEMANLATANCTEQGHKLKLHTPLISLTKAEIIQKGTSLGVDYAQTISCYDPNDDGKACGECDSCILRKKGFAEANIADPTPYIA